MDKKKIKLEKKLILEEPSDIIEVSKLDDRADTNKVLVETSLLDEPILNEIEVEPQEPIDLTGSEIKEEESKQLFERAALINFLNTAIIDEFETIDLYNSYIITIENMLLDVTDEIDEKQYRETIAILSDIVNEEHIHVGQLQKALSIFSLSADYIKDGEIEAEDKINEIEHRKEVIEFDSLEEDLDDVHLTWEEAEKLQKGDAVKYLVTGKIMYVLDNPEDVAHIWLTDIRGSELGRNYHYRDLAKVEEN